MLKHKRHYYNQNQLNLFDWANNNPNFNLNYPASFIRNYCKVSPVRARLISDLVFGGFAHE